MNPQPLQAPVANSRLSRWLSGWNRFWFTPADPTMLGFMRLLTGLVTFYTFCAYTVDLQALLGPHAWLDLEARRRELDEFGLNRPVWSLWFHITDPAEMAIAQAIMILISFLFMIGFCTRLTSILTWLAALSYIHRAPASLFGVDTMMNILLLYLCIGPSGAAFSVDRKLARWWSQAGPALIQRWRCWWGRPAGDIHIPPPPAEPLPSVSANVAIRLLQVHLCIIYLSAGLSKLQGQSWWTGYAIWSTMANFSFAPMQNPWYLETVRLLSSNRVLFEVFFSFGAVFTLFFEITYAFLIWRPGWRPILLAMAFVLHGFIGMFMSLRTFSMMMVVFNLAFVSPAAVKALGNRWRREPAKLAGSASNSTV